MGDFNSHHPDWGCQMQDEDGYYLVEWSSQNNFHLVYGSKQQGTFHSDRPLLGICSEWLSSSGSLHCPGRLPTPSTSPIDHPYQPSPARHEKHGETMMVNFRKSNWEKFTDCTELSIPTILVDSLSVDKYISGSHVPYRKPCTHPSDTSTYLAWMKKAALC